MYAIMKPFKTDRVFKKKIAGFDVETYQTEKDARGFIPQKFLCGSVVGDDIDFFTKDRKKFQKFLLSYPLRDYYIYASNLEFDFIHTFEYSSEFKNFKLIDRNGIIYAKHEKNKNIHEFLDTYNYTGRLSVEKMGEYLKIPKLKRPTAFTKIPANDEEWREMEAYNKNDSYITYKFAKFYCYDFCKSINAFPKMTLASTGMDFWRRNFQKCDIFQERREWIEKHYQGSIHGGRTECIIRGKIDQKFYCFDFNSHYPACCKEGVDGKGSYPLPSSAHFSYNITQEMIEAYEGITLCTIKAPFIYIPLLGITDADKKYIFPCGTINKAWFTNIELREALRYGYEILEIHEGIYYTELFKPFKDAVDFLYKKRMEYKEKGDLLMTQMVKTIMNSGLFGKFAQKIGEKSEIIHCNNVFLNPDGSLYAISQEDKKRLYFEKWSKKGDIFICKNKGELHIPIFIQPILASYTTALGRLKLFKEIRKDEANILYYDTDSLITLKNSYENSNSLGELKKEYVGDYGIFIKPKMYMVNGEGFEKFKIKGLGLKPTPDIWNKLLRNEKISFDKFTRFKESRTRNIGFSYIIPHTKEFDLNDTKRAWNGRFNPSIYERSQPIII